MSEPSQQEGSGDPKSGERKKSVRKKSVRKQSVRKKSMRKQSVKAGGKKRMSIKGAGASKTKALISRDIIDEQNPFIKTGQGIFKFKNHDRYIGEYMAMYPNELFRQGLGVYSTHDGLVYKGTWADDNLVNGVVQWPCGQRYTGGLSMGKYSGFGKYFIPGRGELTANFEDNLPKGKVAFVDEAGLVYTGEIVEGEEMLTLIPLNHYLTINKDELVPPLDKGKFSKKKPK